MSDTTSPVVSVDFAADAAKLKQVEALLARMTKVFLDSADPIVIRDLSGIVLDLNHETERVFGWSRAEVLGQQVDHLLAPQYRELSAEILERMQRGETVRNVESSVRTKTGAFIPVLVTAFLLTDEAGQAVGFAQIAKDISELKQVTEELAQRNRELQQFANVLAHDLSAPLRTIGRYAGLLEEEGGAALNDDQREYLNFITGGIDRMERLISDLLSYTRLARERPQFAAVDTSAALADALANLQAAIVESETAITHDLLPTVVGNRSQLTQLFQNLIGNAIKFRSFEPLQIHVGVQPSAAGWQFSVRDNGIGIDAPYQEKIFEVFRRLHADHVYPGSGVGLAICKTIVERHGGRIWVESAKGKGATFHFTIASELVGHRPPPAAS